MSLSHVDEQGAMRMVDISAKTPVKRTAKARGRITMKQDTLELIRTNNVRKGDVLAAARLAGITGAKAASGLIPLCHNIAIDAIHIDLALEDLQQNDATGGRGAVDIICTAICTDKTGIEMEALTGVAVAALTIYDMCKAADKGMIIEDIRLIEKTKEPKGA